MAFQRRGLEEEKRRGSKRESLQRVRNRDSSIAAAHVFAERALGGESG
jgi:hypothetical protein